MNKIIKLSIITLLSINLNAKENGFSQEQMDQIRTIMKQTQELVNEQQNTQTGIGENIFNDKTKDINKNVQTSVGVNPLGLFSKEKEKYIKIPKEEYIDFENSVESTPREYNKDELEIMQSAIKNQDLKALQKKFHSKQYSGYENTKIIQYIPNKTHKIRTRQAMATTLIFESDIDNFILGDQTGFKAEEIPSKANALAIIPQLIGIDTSLTIFTNDGNIHTFYIFSTDYKNSHDPNFIIKIEDEQAKKIKLAKIKEEKEKYKIIKDGIAEVKVKKSDIYSGYLQKATKENEWLLSAEIFDDKKFTYFKYSKDEMPQIPTIFAVIDNQDSLVETRVIGDYIIAETINPKFTIKSGKSYICVKRKETAEEYKKREIRKKLNIENNNNKKIKINKEKQEKAIRKIKGI